MTDKTLLVFDEGRLKILPAYYLVSFNAQSPAQHVVPTIPITLNFILTPRAITNGNRKPYDVCPSAQQCDCPKLQGVPPAKVHLVQLFQPISPGHMFSESRQSGAIKVGTVQHTRSRGVYNLKQTVVTKP